MSNGIRSTSFRISSAAKQALTDRATREHTTATALLERLIIEGTRQLDHPGITFRGPEHDRRAALAAGPDVWEVVSRLNELDGLVERRVAMLADETGLHSRLIRLALDYAAVYREEIVERIERNRGAAEAAREAAENRQALLA